MNPRYRSTVRKGQRRERESEILLLRQARLGANDRLVAQAAGFWLQRLAPRKGRGV